MRYIKPSTVRKLAAETGHRVGRDFLLTLDAWVEEKVKSCCRLHNGGRKTLNDTLLKFSK